MQDFKKAQKVILSLTISSIRSYEVISAIKRVDQDRISLTFPDDKKDLMKFFREGKELNVVVYTDSGLFVFDSVIIDSPFNADFVIELPDETTKIQHRAYERIPINLNLKLIRNKKLVKTATINIGGGGIRFRVNDFFESGHIWNFILTLPDDKHVVGYGEIVYSLKDNEQNVSIIKFIDISENDRSRIIKLTYDEEIKSKKMRDVSN